MISYNIHTLVIETTLLHGDLPILEWMVSASVVTDWLPGKAKHHLCDGIGGANTDNDAAALDSFMQIQSNF